MKHLGKGGPIIDTRPDTWCVFSLFKPHYNSYKRIAVILLYPTDEELRLRDVQEVMQDPATKSANTSFIHLAHPDSAAHGLYAYL